MHGLGGEVVYPSYNSLLSETPNENGLVAEEEFDDGQRQTNVNTDIDGTNEREQA